MDARELTKEVISLSRWVNDNSKDINYLQQELEKQRLLISDLTVSIKMLEYESERRVKE